MAKITTNIFLSEDDIRKIVKDYLTGIGYEQIGKVEINVRSKKDIPAGATPGDCVGITCNVSKLINP